MIFAFFIDREIRKWELLGGHPVMGDHVRTEIAGEGLEENMKTM